MQFSPTPTSSPHHPPWATHLTADIAPPSGPPLRHTLAARTHPQTPFSCYLARMGPEPAAPRARAAHAAVPSPEESRLCPAAARLPGPAATEIPPPPFPPLLPPPHLSPLTQTKRPAAAPCRRRGGQSRDSGRERPRDPLGTRRGRDSDPALPPPPRPPPVPGQVVRKAYESKPDRCRGSGGGYDPRRDVRHDLRRDGDVIRDVRPGT